MDINCKGAPVVTMFVLHNGELQGDHLSFVVYQTFQLRKPNKIILILSINSNLANA